VATIARQSQLRRFVSTLVLGTLIATPAFADEHALPKWGSFAQAPASDYAPVEGETFFLLADASFGSEEEAQVRIEVPGAPQEGEVARYGGVDIALYRVPDPLAFLATQRNLHRPRVAARFAGEGTANTLTQIWDQWYKRTRRIWQRITNADLRKAATDIQPQLKQGEALARPPRFSQPNRFRPIPGLEPVDHFRYPLMAAAPIQPPKDAVLPGSSSNFIPTVAGNIMVPLGKLAPGLYLVEGVIGAHRANTLVFISNTHAITKISDTQLLVWTADRRTGKAVAGTRVRWTDGAGTLASAITDAHGAASLEHKSPERSYLLGMDTEGGVFVAENFYYDAEIYNTKIYAVTDRPLYRPGNEVGIKILGREFTDARHSRAADSGLMDVSVYDAAGTAIFTRQVNFDSRSGAQVRFRLPDNAPAGGYDIRMRYRDDLYGAAFRVAEYIKPHFEISLVMDKADLHTGEPLAGKLVLRYPDGKPVRDARLSLTVKSQRIAMIDGEMQYANRTPVALEQQEIRTGADGEAGFHLPPATEPSRYAVTVMASDGAAYRVKMTREFLVERGANPWQLSTARRFSAPDQTVRFTLKALGEGGRAPTRWEAQQLESGQRFEGTIGEDAQHIDVPFARSGSYMVRIRDDHGNLLGAIAHWVTGDELAATPGSVEIVLDKSRYVAGETAEALITFPEPVGDALLTLERDRVEQHALLSAPGDWVGVERITPRQFKARIPVGDTFSPNITFSVLYTQAHDYVFANAGLVVAQPELNLGIAPNQDIYRPGDEVRIDITSLFEDKPVGAQVVASVVDEMVYVLQPEIAPPITEFFYHVRRNNVRTTASLAFISYDMARSYTRGAPVSTRYAERGVKVLERPRRDETDTALWAPDLRTGRDGHVILHFTMPDSLTRWRITVRAMDDEGRVGQRTAYIRSDKPAYLKWSGPRRYRSSDRPDAGLLVFNRHDSTRNATLALTGAGITQNETLTLVPGPNYVKVPLAGFSSGELMARLSIDGHPVDALITRLQRAPDGWVERQQLRVALDGADAPLDLPADAHDIRLNYAASAARLFLQAADDLIAYPWGCVEQTSSRLIPLSLAYASLPGAQVGRSTRESLEHRLRTQRERLVALAGPGAVFSWWGGSAQASPFLTGYAYFADWYASRALGLTLPASHWQHLEEVYAEETFRDAPPAQRAMMLWWMQRMGLAVGNQLIGVERALDMANDSKGTTGTGGSVLMLERRDREANALAELLVADLRASLGQPPRPRLNAAIATAQALDAPYLRALLLLTGHPSQGDTAEAILAAVSPNTPTLDRAMTLVWLQHAVGASLDRPDDITPSGWVARKTLTGMNGWQWPDDALPARLQFDGDAPTSGVAVISYSTSSQAPESGLPVRIERTLYRLVPQGEGLAFKAEMVAENAVLETGALYVDEVRLSPAASHPARFGLLEVPLPPGADVEPTTWQMAVAGLDSTDMQPFQRARFEPGQLGYAVPVESLDAPLTVRQLVRFGARGRYTVPPARFFRMYQPTPLAIETRAQPWQHQVE